MNRRRALKTLGSSIATLSFVTAPAMATDNDPGRQLIEGDPPNENVPEASITVLPPWFGTDDTTREAGTFLTLSNGWAGVTNKTEQLLNSLRQTFTYDGETFVLDSVDDWEAGKNGSYVFRHTKRPFPKGETVEVSSDVIVTDSFYDPLRDRVYEEGERYVESVFPTSRTYEIVKKSGGKH